jgi:hypothetical protein
MEEKKGVLEESIAPTSIVGDGTWIEEESGPKWCQKKTRGLWTYDVILYPEDKEQDEGFYNKIWGMVVSYKRIFYKRVWEESNST